MPVLSMLLGVSVVVLLLLGHYLWAMALYLDIHYHIEGLSAEAVAEARRRDLRVQHRYGVRYLRCWYAGGSSKFFCLVEAPSKEAAEAVHRPGRPFGGPPEIPNSCDFAPKAATSKPSAADRGSSRWSSLHLLPVLPPTQFHLQRYR
jgi:hypothetical protein